MRLFALLVSLMVMGMPALSHAELAATCTGKTGKAGSFELTLKSSGVERSYRLHVPASYNPAAGTPLVLSFHGVTSSGLAMEEGSNAIPTSDKNGFIIAHPDGVGASWNAGWCCAPASTSEVNDVQFARDLVTAISAAYCVDPARVYAWGFSNGGFMTHRLGCEAADLFAAIAPHSAQIAVETCKPSRPIPVMQVHGTADVVVPHKTGEWSMKKWAEFNRCASTTTPVYQKGVATCITYDGCPNKADVEFCSVKRMGHDWAFYETTGGAIDSAEFFWEFLKNHPKQ